LARSRKVGAFYTGAADNLVFAMDDDADASSEGTFSNISVFDGVPIFVDGQLFGATDYDPVQSLGTTTGSDDFSSVTLADNQWAAIRVDLEVSADTILSFNYESTGVGEVHTIGFDNDMSLNGPTDGGNFFQIEGTDTFGIQNFRTTDPITGEVSYDIPVGQFLEAGTYANLVLGVDDDVDGSGAATFSDFQVGSMAVATRAIVSSYGADQDKGMISEAADDDALMLSNNAWKSLEVSDFEIDANTVLTFLFRADSEGEIHGIGFDDDAALNTDRFYQLLGTQTDAGIQDYNGQYTAGSGFQEYTINVGDDFAGTFDRLTLVMDSDGVGAKGDSYFADVVLSGVGANDDTIEFI
jgi:hypothetical protein